MWNRADRLAACQAALLLLLSLAVPAAAQVAMPDPTQIAGVPLPAPELPAGTVSVRVVRERMGNNVRGQAVTVTGGGQTKAGTTDAQGRAEFTGFPAGISVVASATVDGEALTSQPLPVPAKGGVRVALIAGIAEAAARERAAADAAAKEPPRPGIVVLGGESRVILEFQNDTPTMFYILDIVNAARTPIDPGAPLDFAMPGGAQSATLMEGSSRQAVVRGDVIRVTGPFAPGTTSIQVGFSLPDIGRSYTWRQAWPVAFEQPFLAVEKVGDLQLTSSQLPSVENLAADGGKTFILASGGRLAGGEELVVSLSNLPVHDMTPRWIAVGLALVILSVGLYAALSPRAGADAASLTQQRERLMRELVAIEERRASGRPKPKDAERRPAIVAELERVLAAIDETPEGGQGAAA
jgi:hypothetical protein